MGWSIDLYRPFVKSFFKVEDKKYRLTHPESVTPTVVLRYQGKLPLIAMKRIAEVFPDFVYVTFVPDTPFAEDDKGDDEEDTSERLQS